MLLAIDSGNTNVHFAIYDGDTRKGEWRTSSNADRTADEYAVWLDQLMQLDGLKRNDVDAAVIANVVPATAFNLRSLCRRYFDCEPLVVGEDGVDLGIKVLLGRPDEVGADRLVNAVGAGLSYDTPLVIIDFGTATTFDIVNGDGDYLGGIICPGISLSLEALHAAAAKLPLVAVKRPPQVIGTGTVTAMQSGVYWGYVSMIEGLVARIEAEYGAALTVIATGGLAPLFNDATEVIQHLDPDLTMRGLLEIYGRSSRA
ncbi:MAG: type III pantothenate kinase [Alphaproteobacteria bacterium]|nr:type III pantothenate kinase [Alphaproteobacteria bacterium]